MFDVMVWKLNTAMYLPQNRVHHFVMGTNHIFLPRAPVAPLSPPASPLRLEDVLACGPELRQDQEAGLSPVKLSDLQNSFAGCEASRVTMVNEAEAVVQRPKYYTLRQRRLLFFAFCIWQIRHCDMAAGISDSEDNDSSSTDIFEGGEGDNADTADEYDMILVGASIGSCDAAGVPGFVGARYPSDA